MTSSEANTRGDSTTAVIVTFLAVKVYIIVAREIEWAERLGESNGTGYITALRDKRKMGDNRMDENKRVLQRGK